MADSCLVSRCGHDRPQHPHIESVSSGCCCWLCPAWTRCTPPRSSG